MRRIRVYRAGALITLVVAIGPLLSGCGLGGLLYGDHVRTVERPFLVVPPHADSRPVRRVGQTPADEPLKAEMLRQQWGPPDAVERLPDSTRERWTYRMDGWRWHGPLLILVIVPVPLLIPYGHALTVFTVQDGEGGQSGIVLDATELRSGPKYGGFCGVPVIQALMLQAPPFVCTAGAVRLSEP